MSSRLSGIPAERRRHVAAILGLFATLCVAVGVVATTGRTTGVVRAFSAVVLVIALLLALIAWGVMRSVKLDAEQARLDEAIDAALDEALAGSGVACSCGHDHDADEMHVTGAGCGHDGTGADCSHSCDPCVLAAMRPSPTTPRSERLAR